VTAGFDSRQSLPCFLDLSLLSPSFLPPSPSLPLLTPLLMMILLSFLQKQQIAHPSPYFSSAPLSFLPHSLSYISLPPPSSSSFLFLSFLFSLLSPSFPPQPHTFNLFLNSPILFFLSPFLLKTSHTTTRGNPPRERERVGF